MIAVSGTHGSGKSTLIASFLDAHGDFIHEPEPYEWLDESDFLEQLEFSLKRLHEYCRGERVIFERSPVDFLAYLRATGELDLAKDALPLVARGLQQLDAIVFLPLDPAIVVPEEEDRQLRVAVDDQLARLLLDDELGLIEQTSVRVIEAYGSLAERLATFESVLQPPSRA